MSERIEGVDGGAMYAGGVRIHGGGKRRSSLDAGMASRTLTIMTRWHESIRSCAGRCSNALQHGDLSSVARRREHGRRLLRIQWTRARHIHTLPNTTVSTYRLFSCEVEYRSSVSVRSAARLPVADKNAHKSKILASSPRYAGKKQALPKAKH